MGPTRGDLIRSNIVLDTNEAAAAKNKCTTSAEAKTIITEAVGYSRLLRKSEESAHAFLTRISAPLRKLDFTIPAKEELRVSDSR